MTLGNFTNTVIEYTITNIGMGHTILHVVALVCLFLIIGILYLQLVLGRQPDIFHLYTFGCIVYVPISTPQRTKMGPSISFRDLC